jgi:hypothetical protein
MAQRGARLRFVVVDARGPAHDDLGRGAREGREAALGRKPRRARRAARHAGVSLQGARQQRVPVRRRRPLLLRKARSPYGVVAGADVVDTLEHMRAARGQRLRLAAACDDARELRTRVRSLELAQDGRQPGERIDHGVPLAQRTLGIALRREAETGQHALPYVEPAARRRPAHAHGRGKRRIERRGRSG